MHGRAPALVRHSNAFDVLEESVNASMRDRATLPARLLRFVEVTVDTAVEAPSDKSH
jgi:hypothetical protein